MNLERKLTLMKQSYLHGYAALLGVGMDSIFFMFAEKPVPPVKAEDYLYGLYEIFDIVRHHYDNVVPFGEITKEMTAEDWDDFATLFRVREILPKFVKFLDDYVGFLRKNNYHAPKDCEISKRFEQIHAEWFEAEDYQGISLKARIRTYDSSFV